MTAQFLDYVFTGLTGVIRVTFLLTGCRIPSANPDVMQLRVTLGNVT